MRPWWRISHAATYADETSIPTGQTRPGLLAREWYTSFSDTSLQAIAVENVMNRRAMLSHGSAAIDRVNTCNEMLGGNLTDAPWYTRIVEDGTWIGPFGVYIECRLCH
jgi:hypothetical protein